MNGDDGHGRDPKPEELRAVAAIRKKIIVTVVVAGARADTALPVIGASIDVHE